MKTRIYIFAFTTVLGFASFTFNCEGSSADKVQSEILELVQTQNVNSDLNSLRSGDNFVLNGHIIDGKHPFIVAIQISNLDYICTGAMIAEHWILTSTHCAFPFRFGGGYVRVYYTPSTGSSVQQIHSANGWMHIHPQYTQDSNRKDLALIELTGALYSIQSFPETAFFFTDPRTPWDDPTQSKTYSFSGYGRGSEEGSGIPCMAGTDQIKRFGIGSLQLPVNRGTIQGKGIGDTKPCKGDSGMPFLFSRFINGQTFPMIFAVQSSIFTNAAPETMIGNLIGEEELAWIFETIEPNSPFRIGKEEQEIPWKRTRFEEMPYVDTEIKGIGGKCLDVDGAKTEPGTLVQLYTCNGTVAQKWTIFPNGQIYYRNNLCLYNSSSEGFQLSVQTCVDSNFLYKFALQKKLLNGGLLTGPFGDVTKLCITARNGSSEDRTPVEMKPCLGSGEPAQTWTWTN
ncbi:hypothetical protein CH373_00395 [Leptospira perolatii]|uniref:Peptidase S1 domain-containing protein n=1 Tax=Leptospira perolatii TaxID=2023191 RepID=A0A2M9ZR56_9LEPT|nr:ricin-type beta-trefoil lectin domain protein [Leptospira perolatii]PJZ71028.1 hypothetical protein CH360_00395 [Leptospira perolatii]PJZ74560.1 hypothetical protein CH373_00395 [Leptospira perolatii]